MAKKKRPPRKAAKPAAEPAAIIPGRKFAVVRTVTLPILSLKLETPAYVTFRGTPRPIGDGAHLLEVLELESNTVMDLEVPEKLAEALKAGYSGGEGENPLTEHKSFCIVRHHAHARKNKYGYSVDEIDPTKPADDSGAAS